VIIEVCIDRYESAVAAQDGGADRLEVCGALGADGITPSAALVEQCVELEAVDVMMMIRPHEGDFCYDAHDQATMLREIATAKRLGVQGVVLGALRADRTVDSELTRRLVEESRPLSVTFHRAFDITPDPFRALDALLKLGIDRLLTSGQAATALQGAALIHQLVTQAGSGLSILTGGGVTSDNVTELIERTGVHEVHTSASEPSPKPASDTITFGGQPRITSAERVRDLVQILSRLRVH
jgi:copper homeostasis protein